MEVADHVHGPPSLSDRQGKIDRNPPGLPINDNPSSKHGAGRSATGVDPNLNGDLPLERHINRNRGEHPNPLNVHPSSPVSNKGHPHNLKRSSNRPNEQLSDVHRHKTHASHSAA